MVEQILWAMVILMALTFVTAVGMSALILIEVRRNRQIFKSVGDLLDVMKARAHYGDGPGR